MDKTNAQRIFNALDLETLEPSTPTGVRYTTRVDGPVGFAYGDSSHRCTIMEDGEEFTMVFTHMEDFSSVEDRRFHSIPLHRLRSTFEKYVS